MTGNDTAFPVLRVACLAPLIRYFGSIAEIADILQANGVDPIQALDPYNVIPLACYLSIFEDAAEKAGDTVMGARLGYRINPADLGPTGLLMLQSATLRQGLHRFHTSIGALQGGTELAVIDDGDTWQVTYQIRSAGIVHGRQDAEFSIAGLCHLIRTSFDFRWRPTEVHFSHDPSRRPDLLAEIFKAPVHFGQGTNRIVLDAAALDRPHRMEDSALISLIERHVEDLRLAQDRGEDLIEAVRAVIGRHLGRRAVTIGLVGRELGIAPRSLQRYLAVEGTTLRALLQDQRMRSARNQLSGQKTNLQAVGHSLGYSDATSFGRAFRSWTGTTPSEANLPRSAPTPAGDTPGD